MKKRIESCMPAPRRQPHFTPLSPRNDVKQRDWTELTNEQLFGSKEETPVDLRRALRLPELEQDKELHSARRWAETTRFTNIKSGTHRALDICERYDFRMRRMSGKGPYPVEGGRAGSARMSAAGPEETKDEGSGEAKVAYPKILVVITVYNEDASELRFTLEGIVENLDNMIQLSKDRPDAAHGWRKFFNPDLPYRPLRWSDFAVVIVSDGILGAVGKDDDLDKKDKRVIPNPSFRDYLKELGLWHDKTVEQALKETRVSPDTGKLERVSTALLFERVVFLPVGSSPAFHQPLQIAYCGKVKNGGKLSSHQVFFDGFCRAVDPDYVFLVDVGTRPSPMSIVRLYAAMEADESVGGCCGDIAVSMRNACDYVNPVFAAQVFEYKTANYIGKGMESFFGFISVLPGAFSAYRWKAIDGPPLSRYFAQLTPEALAWGPFERNIYLAEDRVLCAEIIARKHCKYVLRYVKNAEAETDVPSNIAALMNQRRRWSNGAFFASIYALQNFARVWREASHSLPRRILLTIQFTFYAFTSLINAYFKSFNNPAFVLAGKGLQFIFLSLCALQMLFAVRVKPNKIVTAHTLCGVFFGLYSLLAIGLGLRLIFFTDGVDPKLQWLTMAIFGSFEAMACLHQDPFSVLATTAQYFAFSGVYTIMIPIYSFSNTQDVSWGTRDSGEGTEDDKQLQFNVFSVIFLTVWVMSNVLVVASTTLETFDATKAITVVFTGAAATQAFQFSAALCYIISHFWTKGVWFRRVLP